MSCSKSLLLLKMYNLYLLLLTLILSGSSCWCWSFKRCFVLFFFLFQHWNDLKGTWANCTKYPRWVEVSYRKYYVKQSSVPGMSSLLLIPLFFTNMAHQPFPFQPKLPPCHLTCRYHRKKLQLTGTHRAFSITVSNR